MAKGKDKLVVIWSSADRDVALKMAFMYTLNSKLHEWWKEVVLVVWGPSAELITHDKELQEHLENMKEAGVILEACISCADMYGVTEKLRELGIDVKKMGTVLSDYLKEGRKVITF